MQIWCNNFKIIATHSHTLTRITTTKNHMSETLWNLCHHFTWPTVHPTVIP